MSQLLKKYLERRYIDRNDKAISSLFPRLGAFLRHRKVWHRLQKKAYHPPHEGEVKEFTIAPYNGTNATTLRLQSFLNKINHPAIKAAIVQGSIATGEEISFSDFDGILLIDIHAIQSKRLLSDLHKIVHESAHIMKCQDPLQHHGWSILFKQELNRYPDAELPSVLLEKGKVLFPLMPLQISLVINNEHQDYRALYESLCNGIYRRLELPSTFNSFYHTKLLISECLLLPAAFLQALEHKPVWKAESFEKIKAHLNTDQLRVIQQLSDIRTNWGNYFTGKTKKAPVHPDLSKLLLNSLKQKIQELILEMDKKLEFHKKR